MKFSRTVLSGLIAFLAASGASAQIVKNGSFDDDNADWTSNAPWQGKVVLSNVQYWLPGFVASPDDIGRGADVQKLWHTFYLNTDPYSQPIPGGYRSLSQDLTGLTVGKTYQLSFYEAASNQMDTVETAKLQWGVQIGDLNLTTPAITAPAPHAYTAWEKVTVNFVADASSATLKFLAMASAPVAPEPQLLLDGISISAVPEPASWAMLLAGAGMLAGVVRRRSPR